MLSALLTIAALHWAVHNDDLAQVRQLLAAGADPNATNDYGATPLAEAAITGNVAVLQALLKAGARVNDANPAGQTALMVVARTANVAAARALLAAGEDAKRRGLSERDAGHAERRDGGDGCRQ